MNLFPSQYFLQYSQYYSNCVRSFVNQSNVEDKETRVKDTVIKSVRTGTAKALTTGSPQTSLFKNSQLHVYHQLNSTSHLHLNFFIRRFLRVSFRIIIS